MFYGKTLMFRDKTLMFYGKTLMFRDKTLMFYGKTLMFWDKTLMFYGKTLMFRGGFAGVRPPLLTDNSLICKDLPPPPPPPAVSPSPTVSKASCAAPQNWQRPLRGAYQDAYMPPAAGGSETAEAVMFRGGVW
jgi:hypothetical protein